MITCQNIAGIAAASMPASSERLVSSILAECVKKMAFPGYSCRHYKTHSGIVSWSICLYFFQNPLPFCFLFLPMFRLISDPDIVLRDQRNLGKGVVAMDNASVFDLYLLGTI